MQKILGLAILFTLFVFGCPESSIKEHSAKLDKVFIPVIYFVDASDFEKADIAFSHMKSTWDEEKQHLRAKDWAPSQFEVTPKDIDQRLHELAAQIAAKDKLSAKWTLTDIHCSISEWRTGQGVDYYLDEWYEFKHNSDMLAYMATDQLLDLHEWNELKWLHNYIQDGWYILNTRYPDTEYFSIDDEEFDARVIRINDTLHYLKEAMDCAERENVAAVSHQLCHDIMRTMVLFGDFSPFAPNS